MRGLSSRVLGLTADVNVYSWLRGTTISRIYLRKGLPPPEARPMYKRKGGGASKQSPPTCTSSACVDFINFKAFSSSFMMSSSFLHTVPGRPSSRFGSRSIWKSSAAQFSCPIRCWHHAGECENPRRCDGAVRHSTQPPKCLTVLHAIRSIRASAWAENGAIWSTTAVDPSQWDRVWRLRRSQERWRQW